MSSQPAPKGADPYAHLKDKMGRFRTQSLFYEMRNASYTAPFTLKDKDAHGCLSMYRIYMETADPTEYRTALALLGSWRHWQALSSAPWFKEYLDKWRAELKVAIESERYQEMVEVAETQKGTPLGVQATKWLSDRYSPLKKPKRGRPSKQEREAALREVSEEDKQLLEEAERLGL